MGDTPPSTLATRPSPGPGGPAVLAVVACGGALGSLARWGLALLWPTGAAVLAVNLLGCLAIGVLAGTVPAASRRLRPFLGAGVLGGFTTLSAFALHTRDLLAAGHPGRAAAYAVAVLLGTTVAVHAGSLLGHLATRRRTPGGTGARA